MPSTPPAPLPRSFRAPRAIFWTAFLVRVTVIVLGHTYRIRPTDDHFDMGFEAGRIARSLVTGHGYGNPFNGISGPTAWLPPLFPLLLALVFKVFGVYSRASAICITVLDSLFSALIAPAIYRIAARCFDAHGFGRRGSQAAAPVALWSAWLWALYPAAMQYAVHWVWEMSLSACLFAWSVVLALRLREVLMREEAPARHWRLPAGFGLLWGLIALSNASLLLLFPAAIVWIVWPLRRRLGAHALVVAAGGGVLLTCAVFMAVLTPWILRNERALHAFVPTRANFGIEFWHSTQFAENGPLPWGGAMPMWPGAPEFRRYIALGEVTYAHEKGLEAKRNLRAHPELFVRYTLERAQFFWFGVPHPENRHPAEDVARLLEYSFTSLAGLLGLGLALRRGVPGAGLFALAFLLVPLVYYAVTVQARFRHPLEPLLTICAVYLFRSTGPPHDRLTP